MFPSNKIESYTLIFWDGFDNEVLRNDNFTPQNLASGISTAEVKLCLEMKKDPSIDYFSIIDNKTGKELFKSLSYENRGKNGKFNKMDRRAI